MDNAMMQQLAQFLGVDPTPEALIAALQDLITTLSTPDQTTIPDSAVQAMQSALGVADKAALLGQFKSYADALVALQTAEKQAEESRIVALQQFGQGYQQLAQRNTTRQPNAIPTLVPDEDEADDTPRGIKSRKTWGVPAQIGKNKPSLVGMLADMRAMKTQSYQLGPTGGLLMRHEVVDTFLPALRAALPLFDMGVDEYPMDGVETLSIPRDKTELTAYWVGEEATAPETGETVGLLTLYPKPVVARVRVPNKFLTNALVNYEDRIREKATYAIKNAIMRAALFGTGAVSGNNVGAEPLGLTNNSDVNSQAVATNGAVPTLTDIGAMIGRVEDADVEENDNWAFLFSPRTKRVFADMSDEEGRPLWRDFWSSKERPDIQGYPWYTSTIIPNNQTEGTSTDCSTIFFADWSALALALSNQFEVLIDPYSAAKNLITEIIIYTYSDVAVKYAEAFEVLTGIRSAGL